MLMKSQNVTEVADLRYVLIGCANCKTTVTLDMKVKTDPAQQHGFFSPKKCPGCLQEYDSAAISTIDSLQRLYAVLDLMADRIQFSGTR